MEERWWSAPMTGETGKTIIFTGRDNLDKIMKGGKYPYLIRVSWKYNSKADGFPDALDEELMERVDEALRAEFKKDRCAYLVAVQTGEGERDWLFYTGSLAIFGKVFNRALEDIETVPLEIEAQSDPGWEQYAEMRELTYIPPDENE